MLSNILFGTAGKPHKATKVTSSEAVSIIKSINLDAFELEFVRSVNIKEKKALEIKENSEKENIKISCHAPYYINLNSKEDEKIQASINRIVKSAFILNKAGGNNLVFHSGFFLKLDYEKSIEKTINGLKKIRKILNSSGLSHIILRPELTGKKTQIGSIEELLLFSEEVENTLPCIDFSHYLARHVQEKDFIVLFETINKRNSRFFENMHMHLSGIDFGIKGEKKHLNFKDSLIDYKKVINLLIEYNCKGTVICESPSLEEDALLLKNYYWSVKR
ncbi:MAG: TIM barrel protein [Candidatus Muiribacteriota bacterium]